jgi:acetoin utilization protein AcuB
MFAKEIMTIDLAVLNPAQTVDEVHRILSIEHYHHLPVVENGKLVGLVSDWDLSKTLSPFIGTDQERSLDRGQLMLKVADIMSTNLITVDRHTSVECASILLLEHKISCLPVVDDACCLEGLLTWKDLLQFYVYQTEDITSESYEEALDYVSLDA